MRQIGGDGSTALHGLEPLAALAAETGAGRVLPPAGIAVHRLATGGRVRFGLRSCAERRIFHLQQIGCVDGRATEVADISARCEARTAGRTGCGLRVAHGKRLRFFGGVTRFQALIDRLL